MAIKFKNALTYGYGFNITAKGPVDSRTVVESLADLTSVWGSDAPAYVGMVVAVVEDGNLYTLIADDATNIDNWKQVGSGAGSITVENFTFTEGEDPKIVEAEKVGQIIYVTKGTEDYPAGPYIVTGIGTVSFLTTVPAGDTDLGSAVATLQGKVGTLETDVAGLKTNIANVYTKEESDDRYVAKEGYVAFTQEEKNKLGQITPGDLALKTDLDPINQEIEGIKSEIGAPAEGETAASGIYGVITDVETRLKADITSIPKFKIEVVDELPTENISDTTVYLVKDKDSAGDLYTEYIYVNGAWENLGKQTVDLSGYSTTEQMNQAISTAVNSAVADKVTTESFNQYKAEVAQSISDAESAANSYADGLASNYDPSGAADGVKNELNPKIEGLASVIGAETLGEGEEDILTQISTIKASVTECKVKDVDPTASSGIALELDAEGKVKVTVDTEDLTNDLVGAAGQIGNLSGSSIKIGKDIVAITEGEDGEQTEETIIASTVGISDAIQTLAGQIQAAVAGGITGISGDEYIKVGGTTTSKSLTLELAKVTEAVSNDLIGENSAIQKGEDGKLELVWSKL